MRALWFLPQVTVYLSIVSCIVDARVRPSSDRLQHTSKSKTLQQAIVDRLQHAKTTINLPYLTIQEVHTETRFLFSGCQDCPCDVCNHVKGENSFAPVETHVFQYILRHEKGCSSDSSSDQEPGVVIDVGANAGYFTVLAATLGCTVEAFELFPKSAAFLQFNAAINLVDDQVHLHEVAIGAAHATGTRSINPVSWGGNRVEEEDTAGGEQEDLKIVPLSDVVSTSAVLLKIDTEGYEEHVFKGAMEYFSKYKVDNIVAEVKNWNAKFGMLRNVMRAANLPHVYTYQENVFSSLAAITSLHGRVMDVTEKVHNGEEFPCCEDFWLRREPLPAKMLVKTFSEH